jgi:hypothetical protein
MGGGGTCGQTITLTSSEFWAGFCHKCNSHCRDRDSKKETEMKSISRILIAAVFATSTFTGSAMITSGVAQAASKSFCRSYAKRKADQKVARRVVRDTAVGVGVGVLAGAILGGRRSKTKGAFIGGGLGFASGAVGGNAKWQRAYDGSYRYCRTEL